MSTFNNKCQGFSRLEPRGHSTAKFRSAPLECPAREITMGRQGQLAGTWSLTRPHKESCRNNLVMEDVGHRLIFLWFFKNIILIVFFPLPFSPLIPSPPSNQHTVVHIHGSFLLSAQSLYPSLNTPTSCCPALHLGVCPHFPC